MERAFLTLYEFYLDHHNVVVVAHHLTYYPAAGIFPLLVGFEDEVVALLCHCFFCLLSLLPGLL